MRRTAWASDDRRVCFVEGHHKWYWARAVGPWCLASSTAAWELPSDVVVDKPLTPLAQFLYLSNGDSHNTDLKGLLLDQVSGPCMLFAQYTLNKAITLPLALPLLHLGQKKLAPGCLPHFPLQPIIFFFAAVCPLLSSSPVPFLTRNTEHTPMCRG